MAKFTAILGTANRLVSVEAPNKDSARQEIARQLLKNPQRREIWLQWQASGATIVNDDLQDHIDLSMATAQAIGSLRCLLAELSAWNDATVPQAVYAAFDTARAALSEYEARRLA